MMKSRERIIAAMELEEPDVIPTFEMIISPPEVIERVLGRKSIYNNTEYLLQLRLRGEINPDSLRDRETLNEMYVKDIYEIYCKLDLDMIRFPPDEIGIPKKVRKVDKNTWEIDGILYRYSSYSLWLADSRKSLFRKGPDHVLKHVRSVRKEVLGRIKEQSFRNLQRLVEINKEEKFILADAGGIWGVVVSDPYGVTEVLKWMITRPDVVREMLSFHADMTLES